MYSKKVLIADKQQIVFNGVKALLQKYINYRVVGPTAHSDETFTFVQRHKPEIILMDILTHGGDGFNCAEKIKKNFNEVKIIVLTNQHGKESVKKAFERNVDGYLLKTVDKEELIHCLNQVIIGKKYVSSEVTLAQFSENFTRKKKEDEKPDIMNTILSARGLQVLKLISEGRSNKEISKELNVSIKTVDSHRTNVLKKLKVHNSAEAIAIAYKRGWL